MSPSTSGARPAPSRRRCIARSTQETKVASPPVGGGGETKRNGESIEGPAPGHTRPFTSWRSIPQQNAQQGLRIDARTAATRWGGERMDYGIAIDSLLYRTRRAKQRR